MSLELSLYEIESQLADLVVFREEAAAEHAAAPEGSLERREKQDALAAIDNAIREYLQAELRKVDGVRSFWRHAELMRDAARAEAAAQTARAEVWGARLDRLKTMCQLVMEAMPWPAGKTKKLEGRTGSLILKGNGGRQAVEITNEALIPDEYKRLRVTMSPRDLDLILRLLENAEVPDGLVIGPAAPGLAEISEGLLKPCHKCKGIGAKWNNSSSVPCDACGGTGLAGVPGARLVPRGSHVECK